MAKLNWLVQLRSKKHPYDTGQPVWIDCGGRGVGDQYGNEGYQIKSEAIAAMNRMRSFYPDEEYRLIRITE